MLRVTPTALFDATIDQDKPFLLVLLGTTISLLFFGISRNLVRERQLAQLATDQSVARIREQEASLQVSEARFRLLTSAIKNHAILLLAPDGAISTWNEGARKLFGYDEREILGHPVAQLHVAQPDDIGLQTALQLGQYETMGLRRRRDGSSFLGLTQIFPIRDEQGGCIGFATIVRDVTDEKAAEKELSDAKTLAEAASAAKSAFVANISHELRTPMNAVLGLAQVLARTPLSTEQRQYLEMISGAGKSLLALLNDVLDFSKIEANKLDLEDEDYLLDDVIDAISSVMGVSGGEKGLDMAIRVDVEVPASLHGDAQRVQQVLLNLVSNAVKFTESGSVCLHLRLDPVRPGYVRFDVADTGIGIEPSQMERLFSPFSQADASMARKFGGTGLGLAISKRFAAMMGGVIDVQSRPGAGATFSFSIPMRTGILPDKYRLPAAQRGMRMLYADPTRAGRVAMAELAKRWNCPCDLVGSEQELSDVLAGGAVHTLVICDARLAEQAARAAPPHALLLTLGRGAQCEADLRQPVTRSAIWHLVAGNGEDLPLPASPQKDAMPALAAPAPDTSLAGLVLLLAEDNPLNQVVAKGLLESAGARVELANTGQEALTVLRGNAAGFDLVLMDVQMPVMDGFAATRHIRQDLKLELPIIAMSAGVSLDERAACQSAGMDDFVAKPVDRAALCAAILRHVRRGRQPAAVTAGQPPDGAFNVRHLEELAARGLGKHAALVEMVARALEHAALTADQIRADVGRSDLSRAARGLHSLRGTFGTLGARRVVQATQAAEVQLLADPPRVPGAALEEVWREMAQTETLAREWLQRQPTMNDH
jgi:PAS domain S-box-containing protein